MPKNLKEAGDLYDITVDKDSLKGKELKAFPIIQEQKNINLSLNQSLYSKYSLQQLINHKMSQSILYDEVYSPKLQNYENYLKINHDFGTISGKTVYNVQDSEFIENSANSILTYDDLSLGLGYYNSKDTENSNKEDLESYRVTTSYTISKDYKASYYENYNLIENMRNKQGIGFNIDDSCWNLDLKFEHEILPTSSRYINGKDQKIVLVNLLLKPLGGIKQKYTTNSTNGN